MRWVPLDEAVDGGARRPAAQRHPDDRRARRGRRACAAELSLAATTDVRSSSSTLPASRRDRARPLGQHGRRLPPRPRRPTRLRSAPAASTIERGRRGDASPAYVARACASAEPPLAASSIARTHVVGPRAHRFLVDEGARDRPAPSTGAPPKQPARLPKALTIEQVEQLLAATDGDEPAALRDKALLELLYATGARVSEAVALNVDDLSATTATMSCACSARAASSASCRSAATRARRWRRTWCARAGALARGPRHARAVPRGARLAACRGRTPGSSSGPPPSARSSTSTSRRTACGTRSRPTCCRAAPTCASCRSCSATQRRDDADLHARHGRRAARRLRDVSPARALSAATELEVTRDPLDPRGRRGARRSPVTYTREA